MWLALARIAAGTQPGKNCISHTLATCPGTHRQCVITKVTKFQELSINSLVFYKSWLHCSGFPAYSGNPPTRISRKPRNVLKVPGILQPWWSQMPQLFLQHSSCQSVTLGVKERDKRQSRIQGLRWSTLLAKPRALTAMSFLHICCQILASNNVRLLSTT